MISDAQSKVNNNNNNIRTMFMVLLSGFRILEFIDDCRAISSGCQPLDQADRLELHRCSTRYSYSYSYSYSSTTLVQIWSTRTCGLGTRTRTLGFSTRTRTRSRGTCILRYLTYRVCLAILSVTASSSPIECESSKGGLILRPPRAKMSDYSLCFNIF